MDNQEFMKLILEEIREHREYTRIKLEALQESILGNGKPGLNQRVHDLEQNKDRWDGRWKILAGGVFTGLAMSATLVLEWIKRALLHWT